MDDAWLDEFVHIHLVPDAYECSIPQQVGFNFAVKACDRLDTLKEVIVARLVSSIRNGYIAAGYLTEVVVERIEHVTYYNKAQLGGLIRAGFDVRAECAAIFLAGMDPIMLGGDGHLCLYGARFRAQHGFLGNDQAMPILIQARDNFRPRPLPIKAPLHVPDNAADRLRQRQLYQTVGFGFLDGDQG